MRAGVKTGGRLAAFIMAMALAAGCSGLHAYSGPRGSTPRLEISERRHLDSVSEPRSPGAWVTRYTGHMINPTDRTVTARIDCPLFVLDPVALPPRTVQDFLVEPDPETGALDCSFDYE
jgi:hypothetical protein